MIVVIGECRINLAERQVGVLPLDLFGIPVMSQSIQMKRLPRRRPMRPEASTWEV